MFSEKSVRFGVLFSVRFLKLFSSLNYFFFQKNSYGFLFILEDKFRDKFDFFYPINRIVKCYFKSNNVLKFLLIGS